MNTLTVLCLVVAVACTSGHLIAHPGMYGYPGLYRAGMLPHAAPIALRPGAPGAITLAGAPLQYRAVAPQAVSPLPYNIGPVAPVAPVAPLGPSHSKFHSQDEFGQYSFGYTGDFQARAETRDAYGIVRGSYNYLDSAGKVQTQHYVADGRGFRVSGTNLPEAPAAPALEPVKDTPEVAAAKENFRALYAKAAGTAEPAAEPVAEASEVTEEVAVARKKRALPLALPYAAPFGRFSYGYSAPLTYSHPAMAYSAALPYSGIPAVTAYSAAAPAAVRDSTLLRVVNNPGHAVSYRVD